MNFDLQYQQAKRHKDEHIEGKRRCGGEPYKSYNKLFEIVGSFVDKKIKENKGSEIRILEIGTAVGFTTFVMQMSVAGKEMSCTIDTIEFYQVHIDEAKKNILEWGGDIQNINFHTGEAVDILPTLDTQNFDIVFFDGYGVKKDFYKEFHRLLEQYGILIITNKGLKSTEQGFFDELNNSGSWNLLEEFADTDVFQKLK